MACGNDTGLRAGHFSVVPRWVTPFLLTPRTLPLAVWTVSSLAVYWPLPVWATMVIEYGPVLGVSGWMLAQSVGARRATSHLTAE